MSPAVVRRSAALASFPASLSWPVTWTTVCLPPRCRHTREQACRLPPGAPWIFHSHWCPGRAAPSAWSVPHTTVRRLPDPVPPAHRHAPPVPPVLPGHLPGCFHTGRRGCASQPREGTLGLSFTCPGAWPLSTCGQGAAPICGAWGHLCISPPPSGRCYGHLQLPLQEVLDLCAAGRHTPALWTAPGAHGGRCGADQPSSRTSPFRRPRARLPLQGPVHSCVHIRSCSVMGPWTPRGAALAPRPAPQVLRGSQTPSWGAGGPAGIPATAPAGL